MFPNLPLLKRVTKLFVIQRTNDPPRPPPKAHEVLQSPSQALVDRPISRCHKHILCRRVHREHSSCDLKILFPLHCWENGARIPVSRMPGASQPTKLTAAGNHNSKYRWATSSRGWTCSLRQNSWRWTQTQHRVHHVLRKAIRDLISSWMKVEVSRKLEKHLVVKRLVISQSSSEARRIPISNGLSDCTPPVRNISMIRDWSRHEGRHHVRHVSLLSGISGFSLKQGKV